MLVVHPPKQLSIFLGSVALLGWGANYWRSQSTHSPTPTEDAIESKHALANHSHLGTAPVRFSHLPTATQIPLNRDANSARADHWNFEGTPLSEKDLQPWLENPVAPPARIQYWDPDRPLTVEAPHPSASSSLKEKNRLNPESQSEAVLSLSSNAQIASVRNARNTRMDSAPGGALPKNDQTLLGPNAYTLENFQPGLRDDHKTWITPPNDLIAAIARVDFNPRADTRTAEDVDTLLRTTVVSLGHGGEITLRIDEGEILDQPGADFVLFENPFRISAHQIQQEFASVGVAEMPSGPYHWFPCDPQRTQFSGCAGVVPTDEGGDSFDLSQIGVTRARYIRIHDWGKNANFGRNTEGYDFDGMQLLHAYSL